MERFMVRQARAIETRQEIILAAAEMINEKTYQKASIKEIAVRSGHTQGALYFHFKSKEQIAHTVIEEQNKISQTKATEIMAKNLPKVETMLQISASFTQDIIENQLIRAGVRLTTELQMFDEPPLLPWRDWAHANVLMLTKGIQEGDIKENIDINACADFIVGAYAGVQLLSGLLEQRTNLIQKIYEMWVILINAFTPVNKTEHWLERAHKIFLHP
jgi:AcrR family transcriptional regulator